jgi:glycosyltransferase involved in cell wall biosynthesis
MHGLREVLRYRRIDEVVKGAGAILSTSDALASVLAEQGIPSQREYIFADAPAANFQRKPSTTPVFVFVGRLDVEKGVDTLLQAFALCHADVSESRLRIIGQGALRSALEGLAISLGIQDCVTFTGWKAPDEVEAELGSAWALVAPSRWPEPFGLVAVEAIFRGVPAIVPALGGMAEVVEHGVTGLVFPANDVAALSQCMRDIASGRNFPDRCVAAADVMQARERFGRARHVAAIRGILQGISRNTH